MMKRQVPLLLLLVFGLSVGAQTMRERWLSMPDSLVAYLNASKRIEAMDYNDMGLKMDVTNLLQGSTVMDTLTHDFMEVRLNESALLQMKLLPRDADSIMCVVKTLYAPEGESTVAYYDAQWRLIGEERLDTLVDNYLSRPDTLSETRFAELRQLIEPVMVKARLSVDNDLLTTELSLPLLTKNEQTQVKAILKQRKFKWQNGKFIEC